MLTLQADPRAARASRVLDCRGGGLGWQIGAVTDRGVVREENQDGWAVTGCRDGSLGVLLADGMGGHADGALAARLALQAAAGVLAEAPDAPAALGEAFAAADAAVAVQRRGGSNCGTTLVVAVVHGARCRISHLGDSRAYAIGAGGTVTLTPDHSWVGEQERAGLLTQAQAAVHPRRNVLTRAVTGEGMEPDTVEVTLRPGDLLLLCSDGLWGSVETAMLSGLVVGADPVDALATLVDAAMARGSTDNVTAVSCRLLPGAVA